MRIPDRDWDKIFAENDHHKNLGLFRSGLSSEEIAEFKKWAIDNYSPEMEIKPIFHPIVLQELKRIEDNIREKNLLVEGAGSNIREAVKLIKEAIAYIITSEDTLGSLLVLDTGHKLYLIKNLLYSLNELLLDEDKQIQKYLES